MGKYKNLGVAGAVLVVLTALISIGVLPKFNEIATTSALHASETRAEKEYEKIYAAIKVNQDVIIRMLERRRR